MNMRRFLAAMLALCMVLCLAPVAPVRAAEAEKLEFEKLENVKADLTKDSAIADNRLPEQTIDENGAQLMDFVLSIASGKQTKNEENGYREIAIFKTSITL